MPENNQDNNLITDKVTQEAREGESLVQPEPPVHTSEETTESTQEEAPIGEPPVQTRVSSTTRE